MGLFLYLLNISSKLFCLIVNWLFGLWVEIGNLVSFSFSFYFGVKLDILHTIIGFRSKLVLYAGCSKSWLNDISFRFSLMALELELELSEYTSNLDDFKCVLLLLLLLLLLLFSPKWEAVDSNLVGLFNYVIEFV